MKPPTRQSIPLFDRLPFYSFDVPLFDRFCSKDRRGRGVSTVVQDVVLPHEAVAALYAHHRSRFHQIMATHAVPEFWSRQPQSRLRTLPGWTADRAARSIPLKVFGNDAAVCTTMNCNVVLLCSACAFRLPARLSRVPICVTPMRFTDSATFRQVYKVVVWSLRVLAGGVWPMQDPWGKDWPLGSWRRSRAGQPLAGPWTGMFYEAGGDWKWTRQTFHLPWHYNQETLCHKCHATKSGPCSFLNLSRDAPRRQPRSMAEFLAHLADHDHPRPPLCQFEGFSVQDSILLDWMHNNWLGVAPIAIASALLELIECEAFGTCQGDRRTRLEVFLKRAWVKFCEWSRSQGLRHSQQCFTPASISASTAND